MRSGLTTKTSAIGLFLPLSTQLTVLDYSIYICISDLPPTLEMTTLGDCLVKYKPQLCVKDTGKLTCLGLPLVMFIEATHAILAKASVSTGSSPLLGPVH